MKLILGDSYKEIKNIPDKSIDLVYADPPYEFCSGGKGSGDLADRKDKNKQETYELDSDIQRKKVGTGYSSGGGCFGTKNRSYHSEINETDVTKARQEYLDYIKEHGKDEESERLRIIANAIDNRTNTAFISKGIDNSLLDELVRVMKKVNIYLWCNKAQLRQYIDYFDDLGCFIDVLTWHKTNAIPTCNGTYVSDTEYLVFARESGVKLYGTVETKRKFYISSCNVKDKDLYEHPTIKPLDFVKNHIINSTQKGDIVLDCFMGSGTTGVACKELDRDFIGIEINEKYYNIAKDRINGVTQKDRKKINEGQITLFDMDV